MGSLIDTALYYEMSIPVICGIEIMYGNAVENRILTNIYGLCSAFTMTLGYIVWRVERDKGT